MDSKKPRVFLSLPGLPLDASALNAGIAACGRGRCGDEALRIRDELLRRGVRADVFTYNSLMRACRWDEALLVGGLTETRSVTYDFAEHHVGRLGLVGQYACHLFLRFPLNAGPTDARMHPAEGARGCLFRCAGSLDDLCHCAVG